LNRFETLGIGLNLAEAFRAVPDGHGHQGIWQAIFNARHKKMFQNGLINLD
jgi:hypothetical protein